MTTQPCRFMDRYPEGGRGPVPVEHFSSPAYIDQEHERVFRRKWLNVGNVLQAPNPGDYFVAGRKLVALGVRPDRARLADLTVTLRALA